MVAWSIDTRLVAGVVVGGCGGADVGVGASVVVGVGVVVGAGFEVCAGVGNVVDAGVGVVDVAPMEGLLLCFLADIHRLLLSGLAWLACW